VSDPALPDLLLAHRTDLTAFVARNAGRLLRWESADDLVQGVHLRAIERGASFRWRGREPFLAWLHTVARSHLADRHAYWAALRRRPSRLVRLGTTAGGDAAGAAVAATSAGPSTHASRREQLEIALRALALLLPRDRDLVRWTCDDVPFDEQAARLGVTRDAADRARRRAVERFRKAYELASRG
jgi:RNA polymerase sigma factor (sigma-70 family)